MKKKIILSAIATALILTAALPMNTLAATSYSVCTVDNCYTTKDHKHNGTWYQGHNLNDGHGHEVCSVTNCTKTWGHKHSGTSYMGHHSGDGHNHNSSGNRRHHGGGRHH